MGKNNVYVIPTNAFVKLELPIIDNSQARNGALLAYYKQSYEVAKKEYSVAKSGFLPGLSVGYFNQQINGVGDFSGVQLGVAIPLLFWTQLGKAQATKLGSDIAKSDNESQVLMITTMFQSKQQEINKYLLQLEWYENQGLKTADELLRFANIGYQAGEIDYMEYINSAKQASTIKTEYLSALKQYNQSVIDLQYLSGSFK